jgi:hypothetical protein
VQHDGRAEVGLSRAARSADPVPLESRLVALPGVRVFRSSDFRRLLAALLWAIGIAVLGSILVRQAGMPLETGQFGIDLADYHRAAGRLAAGGSPYAPDMLLGPVNAQGVDRYRYPPPLAQLLVPVSGMPLLPVAVAWLALQAAAAWLATWIAATAGGATRSLERALWTGVAVTYFMPVFDTIWKGNVSAFVALAVALALLGGPIAATAAVAGTYLKVVPGLLVASAPGDGRRSLAVAAGAAAALAGASVVLSPAAWADYGVVLPNLLRGSADYANNLAPTALVATALPGQPAVVDAARAATLVAAVVLVLAAVRAGTSRNPLMATACATAAMLLLPGALWYHYLAALLPLAAAAWPRATAPERATLLLGSVLTTAGVTLLVAAAVGSVLLIATAAMVFSRPAHAPRPAAAAGC